MDSLHREYLDEMGIAVFSLRPAKLEVSTKHTEEALEVPSPEKNAPKVLGESAQSARLLLKQQLSVGLIKEKSSKNVDKNLDHKMPSAKEPSKNVPSKEVKTLSDSPNFFFCFLDYENISLMLSLDISANALPAEVRQLCDDIVFALSKERKIPKMRELRWPMVSAAHIQQTSEDARMILGEMIKQSCENLILFGSDTAEYRAEKIQGTYLLVENIEHYLKTPMAKAALWQKLAPLHKAL